MQVGREVKRIRPRAAAGNEEKDGILKAEGQTERQQRMGGVGKGERKAEQNRGDGTAI